MKDFYKQLGDTVAKAKRASLIVMVADYNSITGVQRPEEGEEEVMGKYTKG